MERLPMWIPPPVDRAMVPVPSTPSHKSTSDEDTVMEDADDLIPIFGPPAPPRPPVPPGGYADPNQPVIPQPGVAIPPPETK